MIIDNNKSSEHTAGPTWSVPKGIDSKIASSKLDYQLRLKNHFIVGSFCCVNSFIYPIFFTMEVSENMAGSTNHFELSDYFVYYQLLLYILPECQINEYDEDGLTPLMWSSMYGQTDVMLYLLSVSARADVYNHEGTTGLMMACYHGNHGAVKVLLDARADIDQVDVVCMDNKTFFVKVFKSQEKNIRASLKKR
jgi:hypothetical protein